MGALANLVTPAQPALFGGGCSADVTEGSTWRFQFVDITDSAGDTPDFGTVTGTCEVLTNVSGFVVATLTFVGGLGEFTLYADESVTGGLVDRPTARPCRWRLTLADGTDVVTAWGAHNSPFTIHPER